MKITPSLLFDFIQCPHKVWRDQYGPQDEKLKISNPFIQLLWDRGIQHEQKIVDDLKEQFVDISEGSIQERIDKTAEALRLKKKLIYQGIIQNENLFGIPDLLELDNEGNYIPIDIKSGVGLEGVDDANEEEGKQKKHYAVQLCLYVEILESMHLSKNRIGIIIDRDCKKVEYDLMIQIGKKNPETFWDYYTNIKQSVQELIANTKQNDPAMSSICKLCSWYESCHNWCISSDDLTQIFYVGRKFRDTVKDSTGVSTVAKFVDLNIPDLIIQKNRDKSFLKGIGENSLTTAVKRAKILKKNSDPISYTKYELPVVPYELFFDIEDDPTQEFVYLHGLYVRNQGKENFKFFVAKEFSEVAEKIAWQQFWEFIRSLPTNEFSVYYFSQHERTTYRRLQKKYPDVVDEVTLNNFFDSPNVIDLYQIVLKNTDWPLGSYSIKAIASYLGFKWRDETPSGALSIQWYNEYLKTGDEKHLIRILEYNEDDCKATMVLKDKLLQLQLNP